MTYPEKGASYRHQPKWLERTKQAERADGGSVSSDDQDSNVKAAQVAAELTPAPLPIAEAARYISPEAALQFTPGVLPIAKAIRKLSGKE